MCVCARVGEYDDGERDIYIILAICVHVRVRVFVHARSSTHSQYI